MSFATASTDKKHQQSDNGQKNLYTNSKNNSPFVSSFVDDHFSHTLRYIDQKSDALCSCDGNCPRCRTNNNTNDVSRVIQDKLNVSQPANEYEQEADRIAEQIVNHSLNNQINIDNRGRNWDAKRSNNNNHKNNLSINSKTTTNVDSHFSSERSTNLLRAVLNEPGQPLDNNIRRFMESRFGNDFSSVRIHTGEKAARSTESFNAIAFTFGSNVIFGKGQYQPNTLEGKKLVAHELTHVTQGPSYPTLIMRKPKLTGGDLEFGSPELQSKKEEWVRLQVDAIGMDDAAKKLSAMKFSFRGQENRNIVFVGLHPQFVKVYDSSGKSLGKRIALKKVEGLKFNSGVYISISGVMFALTIASDKTRFDVESLPSIIGHKSYTKEQKAAIAKESKKAESEGREPAPAPTSVINIPDLLSERDRYYSMLTSVPNHLAIYFVPKYINSGSGKGSGESKGLYSSPIEGREDGQSANAPPWPVLVDGPKMVPRDSTPTFSAKIDWTANGNYSSVSLQAISQIGETIHYKWELFDITKYAKEQIAKDPAATKDDPSATPVKSIEERVNDFKKSKIGSGADVTGMGGANREFRREFEDWLADTKRARKRLYNPSGDTVGERLSNTVANRLSLELAPVSLLVTAIGAVSRWMAELFAGPRQQQEIHMETDGIYLIRLITTPAINEDREGKQIIRPPSVAAKVTEVRQIERVVREALDEPGAQIAELQSQIDLAEKDGQKSKAEYLKSLLEKTNLHFKGSPLTLLQQSLSEKEKDLIEFRNKFPNLSDFTRVNDIQVLKDRIALYEHHQKMLTTGGGTLNRVNATLISEVTGEQYPLLISAGPMAMLDGSYRWMISDVTNRDGDAFIGLGDSPSTAFKSALTKFGDNATYGSGLIGVDTAGLNLEKGAPLRFIVESKPADWALTHKRIDDLVTTLAALGLIVSSAGTASAVIGAGVAAARLMHRWHAGKLYLDAQTVNDVLGVLGGLGTAGQLAAGLRVQKFERVFAIIQEGRTTEAGIAAATKALNGAQKLARGVELANEALNYGGLLWGNIEFIDQMMSISEQEHTGTITHAAARRARANAISSAIQNNGLFIAGNVIEAKLQVREAIYKRKSESKKAEPQVRIERTSGTEMASDTLPPKPRSITKKSSESGEKENIVDERLPVLQPHEVFYPEGLAELELTRAQAYKSYLEGINADPYREVAIYMDPSTHEHVVVQGNEKFVTTEWMPEAGQGRQWELVEHYHPSTGVEARFASPNDFAAMMHRQLSNDIPQAVKTIIRWTDPQSKIQFSTEIGYTPSQERPYWIRYRDAEGTWRVFTFEDTPWNAGSDYIRFLQNQGIPQPTIPKLKPEHSGGSGHGPASLPPATPVMPSFNRMQTARLRDIYNEMSKYHITWESLGFSGMQEMASFFVDHDINAGIRVLETRLRARINFNRVYAEEQRPSIPTRHAATAQSNLPQGRGAEVPEGQRLPRSTEIPDSEYGGFWSGHRGDSWWFSDIRSLNIKTNWEPIQFRNGYPDLYPWKVEHIYMKTSNDRDKDFAYADRVLAKQRGFANQTAYTDWREANRLTWHHVEGKNEMILVPRDIHENLPHEGSVAQFKSITNSK